MKLLLFILSFPLLAPQAHALFLEQEVCEHATRFSGCGEAWMGVRLVARLLNEQGCADSVLQPEVDSAALEIRHCTRPQGIYDLPLAPVKSACAELATLRFRNRAIGKCRGT